MARIINDRNNPYKAVLFRATSICLHLFMTRYGCAAFAAVWLVALSAVAAVAQDKRQNEPGQFDFYVLSLSWAPSFCDAVNERSPTNVARQPVCGDHPSPFG